MRACVAATQAINKIYLFQMFSVHPPFNYNFGILLYIAWALYMCIPFRSYASLHPSYFFCAQTHTTHTQQCKKYFVESSTLHINLLRCILWGDDKMIEINSIATYDCTVLDFYGDIIIGARLQMCVVCSCCCSITR